MWLRVYRSEFVCVLMRVFDCERESHICMMCDLHTPHALTRLTAALLGRGSVGLYIMKWGNTDLFLALKSTCCNGALVSAFSLITWHMLRLWASKTRAFRLLGDVMELLKRMNNHHQNTRMFIGDWTGSSTDQLNAKRGRRREWLERVRTKQRRKGEREGCMVRVWPVRY